MDLEKFETAVKQRVWLKTSQHLTDFTVLVRTFKYFDLEGTGKVNFLQWKKALQKLGLNLEFLNERAFMYYDEGDGIDYQRFSAKVLSKGFDAIEKIRRELKARNGKMLALSEGFLRWGKEVNYEGFFNIFERLGAGLRKDDIERLFLYYEKGNGVVWFEDIFNDIIGDIKESRMTMIRERFLNLNSENKGFLDSGFIKNRFCPDTHPDVISGNKTSQEVFLNFTESFDINHLLFSSQRENRVFFEEFFSFFKNLSFLTEDESKFEMILSSWKQVTSKTLRKTSHLSKPEFQTFTKRIDPLFLKFKAAVVSKGPAGFIGLQRSFIKLDTRREFSVTFSQFKKICQDMGLGFSNAEILRLFNTIDREKKGVLDYQAFLIRAKGPFNERRKELVGLVFEKLDPEKKGYFEMKNMNQIYDARNHPEVKSGKKQVLDMLNEFFDSFSAHHEICEYSMENKKVNYQELEEYYYNISAGIEDDTYFEDMIKNVWKLESNKNMNSSGFNNQRVLPIGMKQNTYNITV